MASSFTGGVATRGMPLDARADAGVGGLKAAVPAPEGRVGALGGILALGGVGCALPAAGAAVEAAAAPACQHRRQLQHPADVQAASLLSGRWKCLALVLHLKGLR